MHLIELNYTVIALEQVVRIRPDNQHTTQSSVVLRAYILKMCVSKIGGMHTDKRWDGDTIQRRDETSDDIVALL